MKVLSFFKYVFSAVGIILLVGGFLAYKNTSDFLLDAISAQGTVTGLEQSRSSDSVSYYPIVSFIGINGQPVKFRSSVGSSRSSYAVGEKVEVLYSSSDPAGAKLKSFFALWGATLVMAIMGAVFLSIGGLIFLIGVLKGRKRAYLQRNGVAIEAKIQSVEVKTNISMNGQSPFVVVCQWLNPMTRQLHTFESENIWFDPTPYIEQDTVTVLVEKDNPEKYYVDISFLPKLAA
ncbi:DUF3592 domain-containing protein [Pseudomonas sp. S09G 359]|uniref:DUF3592 domain-containing protein n=1 Tax=Pseudomonas sp. S09G 359 TaxID=2054919 RepID=UPI000C6CCBF9|nr:DUF3592 domain-containing protein [Pseudomonas sp. S09G 359]AUG07145.1 DUF3592 domain-containing protein [Pseudomonas sp. S09G 359]